MKEMEEEEEVEAPQESGDDENEAQG